MTGPRRLFALVLGLLGLLPQPGRAEATASYADEAAALVETYARSDLFSGAVIVAQNGQVLWRGAYGLANREWDIPNVPDAKFRIGSVTKQFTAAAILLLAQDGKLKLDDPVSRYVADAPATWNAVTIRHLLTHSSGIPSYTALPGFAETMSRTDRTPQEILGLVRNLPLEFEPGSRYSYDNSGYVLLGAIIETVSGEPYADVLRRRIFAPLGMRDTGYDDTATILPRRVAGYKYKDGSVFNADYVAMSLPFAAGALYSTVDDLLRWNESLSGRGPAVLDPASRDAMFTDAGHGYGFGWILKRQHGRRLQTHGGIIDGFRAIVDRYPDEGLDVIVLANLDSAPVERIAGQLAALCFGALKPSDGLPLDPAVLDRFLGVYRLGPGFVLRVTRTGDRLYAQGTRQPRVALFADAETSFFAKVADMNVRFEGEAGAAATDVAIRQNGRELTGPRIGEAEAKAIEEAAPRQRRAVAMDLKAFDPFVGAYRLGPNATLTVAREGDRLTAQVSGQPRFEAVPEGDREVFLKGIDAAITFEAGADGQATGLVLHQGGLDIPAPRVSE